MFVTVFPMVCHILAFLVSFYIKNLSQTVQCLYFEAELPLEVPTGHCPLSLCLRWASVASTCADWNVKQWAVEVMFFPTENWNKDVCISPSMSPATFFVIALLSAALLPCVLGGVPGLCCCRLTPRAKQTNLSSLYRKKTAAPLISFCRVSSPELYICSIFLFL